ncbi:hypothetical protein ACFW04_003734 [Cataglyphis niger]
MKTLVLVTCLLTISYAADPQILKKVYDNYKICLEELNEQQWTPEVLKCYFYKVEEIDEQGILKKEEILATLDNIISDKNKLRRAKELAVTCIDQGYQGPGRDYDLDAALKCGMPITDLIDKPQ